MKDYYYMRNGMLHKRYVKDEAVLLSESETERIKNAMTSEPYKKQDILKDEFNFLTKTVGRKTTDGIKMVNERIFGKNKI